MKLANTVVSVLVIAAVLVFAYGVGLLVRQARTGGSRSPSSVAEANDAAAARRMTMSSHGPGASRTKDVPEERTRLREEKAKTLEKMNSMTEEEKEKFRNQVRRQVGGRRGSKGVSNLSPEEQQAQKIGVQSQSGAGRQKEDANTPATEGGSTNPKPSTDNAGSEPGKAGPS
jgi:hypothetical protein